MGPEKGVSGVFGPQPALQLGLLGPLSLLWKATDEAPVPLDPPMTPSRREKTPDAASVARAYLAAVGREAAWGLDAMARLSILEGAASVPPGTWVRRGKQGVRHALEHFGGGLSPLWTSPRNQRVYQTALKTADKRLRSIPDVTAEDLTQEMMSASASPSSPKRKRVFYSVGQALRRDESGLRDGTVVPQSSVVLGTLRNWVTRAAQDEFQNWKRRSVERSFAPSESPRETPLEMRRAPGVDPDVKEKLLLMALQSPGGPGLEIRKIIDDKVDRAFPPASASLVRAFLHKISSPKYRSPAQMREMLGRRFKPEKWFSQALRMVRKEIMEETGASPQQVSNVLGGGARNVFRFMRDHVGKDPRVQRVFAQLKNQVEILEPGVFRVAEDQHAQAHDIVRRWLENRDRHGGLESGTALALLNEFFEMNEYGQWDDQTGPHAQHNRGPSPLRVASFWLRAKSEDSFERWVSQRKFPSPKTRDPIQFKSLPSEEQARIRSQWEKAKKPEDSKGQRTQDQQWEPPKKQIEQENFTKWLGDADPQMVEDWNRGDDTAKLNVVKKFKDEHYGKKTTQQRIEGDKREQRFKDWIGEQDQKTQKAWESGDRGKMVEVRQQFSKKERQESKDREEKSEKEHRERKEKARVPVKKLMSMPKDERPAKWIDSDDGNRLYGSSAEVSEDSKVSGSQVAGTIDGGSTVSNSSVGQNARVDSGSQVSGSKIESGGVVEDKSTVVGAEVGRNARVRGSSKIRDAKILGGTWDGVDFDGKGGTFHDSYDEKTLKALTSIDTPKPGPGDGPLRAMTRYLQDGGRTKKFMGGKMDRKRLSNRIQKHIYNHYDRDNPWLGRGASFLDRFDDEEFETLMDAAQRKADDKPQDRKKKAMLYHLTKTALEHPELRGQLMPLVRMAREAKQAASGTDNLRERVIRAAYETDNLALRGALVRCVVAADESAATAPVEDLVPKEASSGIEMTDEEYRGLVRVAYSTNNQERRRHILGLLKQAKFKPNSTFMKWTEGRKFKNPDTNNLVKFISLPPDEQTRIHEQWKKNRKERAQKYKPKSLSEDTVLTPEKFDDVEEGDMIWVSWSPKMLHEVIGKGETKKNKKPYLTVVITDPKTGKKMEKRNLYKSSTQNQDHEIHLVPKDPAAESAPKTKDEAKPQEMLEINDEMMHKLEQIEKGNSEIDESLEKPLADSILQKMNANAAAWLNKPGMPGKGAQLSDKDGPYVAGAQLELTQGGYEPLALTVLSEKLVEGPNGVGVLATSEKFGPTILPFDKDKPMKGLKQTGGPKKEDKKPEKPKAEEPEKPEESEKSDAPKTGEKYKDRKKLKGKARPDSASVYLPKEDWPIFTPEGLGEEELKKAEESMKKATVGLLRKLKERAGKALSDPEGNWAKAMADSGYGADQLKKMQEYLNKKLRLAEGRTYSPEVLDVWNRNDLEEEDADELYNFRVDKPPGGKKLTDAQIMQKFLAQASPETRERMKGMSLDDFMIAYKSILDADEDEELEA